MFSNEIKNVCVYLYILRSIQACWEKTIVLSRGIAQTNTGSSVDFVSKKTLKEVGNYLMFNFISLRYDCETASWLTSLV